MKTYFVQTQDVDGKPPARKYAKLENALNRFVEMYGYTIDVAIEEHYYAIRQAGGELPRADEIKRLRGVSMFGTVVTFWVVEKTDAELADEKQAREWNTASRKAKAERKALMKAERERRAAEKLTPADEAHIDSIFADIRKSGYEINPRR